MSRCRNIENNLDKESIVNWEMAMGLNLQAMEKITADVQMKDLKWVEVGEGSYFKVLKEVVFFLT